MIRVKFEWSCVVDWPFIHWARRLQRACRPVVGHRHAHTYIRNISYTSHTPTYPVPCSARRNTGGCGACGCCGGASSPAAPRRPTFQYGEIERVLGGGGDNQGTSIWNVPTNQENRALFSPYRGSFTMMTSRPFSAPVISAYSLSCASTSTTSMASALFVWRGVLGDL